MNEVYIRVMSHPYVSGCGSQCGEYTHTWKETFENAVVFERSQEKEPTRETVRRFQRHKRKTRGEKCYER